MTLAEIYEYVNNQLQDTLTYRRWEDTELKVYINEGYRDFIERTGVLIKTGSITLVASTATYSIPSDCINIMRVSWDGIPLQFRSTWYMDEHYGTNWRTTTGNAIEYIIQDHHGDSTIRVYPIPDSTVTVLSLSVDYTYYPSDMSDEADEPAFHQKYHKALVYYCCSECLMKEFETKHIQRAQMYMSRYEKYVGRAKFDANTGWLREQRGIHLRDWMNGE